jgi:uncharacterized RDD family membrane protein YckC
MSEVCAWPRAGLPRRLASIVYDLLLVVALMMLLSAAVILARAGDAVGPGAAWFQLLLIACWWLYFTWSWTHGGQTVGMRAWRLHLVADDGGCVGWRAATLRFGAAGLSAVSLGLGFLAAMIDRESRTWHDRLSGTELRVRPKNVAQVFETN